MNKQLRDEIYQLALGLEQASKQCLPKTPTKQDMQLNRALHLSSMLAFNALFRLQGDKDIMEPHQVVGNAMRNWS